MWELSGLQYDVGADLGTCSASLQCVAVKAHSQRSVDIVSLMRYKHTLPCS